VPRSRNAAPEEPYGLVAEFDRADDLVRAARSAYQEGYRAIDGYSPFPIEELGDVIGFHKTGVPILVLIGGLSGAAAGYLLQYWVSVLHYPLNIGGRPLHSWPAFIPVTFECAILAASITAVVGMLALNGLPRPHHPLFGVPGFDAASQNRFFLAIERSDGRFDPERTRRFLEDLQPKAIHEVRA
jgi:hypothetical protein